MEAVLTESREEHVEWCKARAMEYYNEGDMQSAVTSMVSDMDKREDTKINSALVMLSMTYLLHGSLSDIKRWIQGFR
jgi:hypothetical protein